MVDLQNTRCVCQGTRRCLVASLDGMRPSRLVLVAMAVENSTIKERHNSEQHQILVCLQLGCEEVLQERRRRKIQSKFRVVRLWLSQQCLTLSGGPAQAGTSRARAPIHTVALECGFVHPNIFAFENCFYL